VPIDPEMAAFVERAADIFDSAFDQLPLVEQRRLYGEFCRRFEGPWPAGVEARDRTVDGPAGAIPVRVYRPRSAGFLPAVIYFHGGGWVFGSPDTHGQITATLAARIPAAVVSVDYRLAPEHRFPAAFDDSYAALQQVFTNAADLGIDRRRLAVAGDSAGANLSAAVALAARDRGGPALSGQGLVYGIFSTDFDRPSYLEHAEAPFLTRASMIGFVGAYLGGPVASDDPYAAPMAAASHAALPPAFIAAAGIDPLRDDSAAYAARLQGAGVAVEQRCAPDLIHGYLRAIGSCRAAAAEFDALCAWLARRLAAAS
jgi:acetyl esterase